jgi:hypothetical protein
MGHPFVKSRLCGFMMLGKAGAERPAHQSGWGRGAPADQVSNGAVEDRSASLRHRLNATVSFPRRYGMGMENCHYAPGDKGWCEI